jgi:hypothetical protein
MYCNNFHTLQQTQHLFKLDCSAFAVITLSTEGRLIDEGDDKGGGREAVAETFTPAVGLTFEVTDAVSAVETVDVEATGIAFGGAAGGSSA